MRLFPVLPILALACASPAVAQSNVNFNGNVSAGCTITLGTTGTLTLDTTSGTTMTTEPSGFATFSIAAAGSNPTVSFAQPTLPTSPAGWGATPDLSIKYTSTRGASQDWTSSSSNYIETGLIDTFTIHGRIVSATGFAAGSYQLRTVVTCS